MKPPAFQFYADDFLAGTLGMSDAEVGLYIRLLCVQWSSGSLPNDDDELMSFGRSTVVQPNLNRVKSKFSIGDDGRLRNNRLEQERTKQNAFRAQQSAKGKASAQQRFNRNSTLVQPSGEPEANSPSPSPSPIISTVVDVLENPETEKPKRDKPAVAIPEKISTPEFIASWDLWLSHLKAKRKSPTAHAMELQLKKLSELSSVKEAINWIHNAIEKNWQGLYEPNNSTISSASARPVTDRNAGTANEGKSSQYAGMGKILRVPDVQRPTT